MKLAEAKAIVKAKYPRASCQWNSSILGFFIHETKHIISAQIGTISHPVASDSPARAWVKSAEKIRKENDNGNS